MIIEIILINFFQKYYMNKNLKNTLINYFPLISIFILGLIYLYLNTPDNLIDNTINKIIEQSGGAGTESFDYPPNTPFLFKYRIIFVTIPILLIGVIIYYAYYNNVTVKSLTIWDLGLDFFSNFQKQHKAAIVAKIDKDDINYNYDPEPAMLEAQPELAKMFNIIKLTANPLSALYIKGQYFCNSARPCNCCLDDNYTEFFFNCVNNPDSSKPKCTGNPQYTQICLPSS